ncbi:hypothetical protein KEM60_01536 [Austwickia sp. TVS 96-490-7B]|uniref:hypothetical protein n=1 Tax=Austwickia sp. TVS 96-490-7B TaxID=2830843 RepID=UPI001C570530|nr:hypothetical protein [Austwickia sp. TVS 96-490-7B]MBW3085339.1 hypothetical protein [Austwickia sp. TVS 96-490-7B]
MRTLRTELRKVVAYRLPLFVAVGALLLVGLWDVTILARGQSGLRAMDSSLAFSGIVLPTAWFIIPMLLVGADTCEGTLWPALHSRPGTTRVLMGKAVAAVVVAVVTALLAALMLAGLTLVTSHGAPTVEVLPAVIGRLLIQAMLCTVIAFSIYVLTGYQGASWIILGLLVWIHFVERVLSSALPGNAGMLGMPFRLVDFWIRGKWSATMPQLEMFGFGPLAVYTAALAALAAGSFIFFSDSSGRTWGRKRW